MRKPVPGMIIRRTGIPDLHNIYMLGMTEKNFSAPACCWDASSLAEIFAEENCVAYTAARKKEIAGFIIGKVSGCNAELKWIFVKEKFRRRGVGTDLLDRFKENLKKSGVTDFFVALFPDKNETENFFIKHNMIKRESFIRLSGKP